MTPDDLLEMLLAFTEIERVADELARDDIVVPATEIGLYLTRRVA